MQALNSLALMSIGVAVVAYVYAPPRHDRASDLAEVTRISAAPDRGRDSTRAFIPRTFSATSPLSTASPAETARQLAALPPPQRSKSWSAVVRSDVSADNGKVAALAPSPVDAAARRLLAKQIQIHLKDAGCYDGRISGRWTSATQRAMAAFMSEANASLPVDSPDRVLLALVRNNQDASCQSSGSETTVAALQPAAPIALAPEATQSTSATRPHAALPQVATVPPVRRQPPRVPTWSTETTIEVEPITAPAVAKVARTEVPPPVRLARERLPGRMAVGVGLERAQHTQSERSALIARVAPITIEPIPESDRRQLAALSRDDDEADDIDFDNRTGATQQLPTRSVTAAPDRARAEAGQSSSASAQIKRATRRAAKSQRRALRRGNASRNPKVRSRRRVYAYGGTTYKRRRGEPRRGTMQFNVVQALGGIY